MTAVRPPVWPTVQPPAPGGAGNARASARGAFFEQALGRASGQPQRPQPAQAVQPTTVRPETMPQPHAERVRTTFTPPSEPPQRILRPGSLLDIKV
mgnify:FL=1